MSGRILHEPTGEHNTCWLPHEETHPTGTIWLCDCGRLWTKSDIGWSSSLNENTPDQRLLRLERWKDKP